ncbi:cytochrome P450 2J4-like [Amphiura filiformis]|uniref:cytochrome P450 2J4-like n=1 Tax=Amphiura filiformis TaxID=82378 RepID=UPI003B20F410
MIFIANIEIQSVLFCVVVFLFLSWWLRSPKDFPPGPWGWPLLGYLPNLVIAYRTGQPLAQLLNLLAKKYGPVFSLNLAGKSVIVLNNFKYVKEGLNNPSVSDRPRVDEADDGEGLAMASGEPWKERRRLTLTILHSFGVGKRSFEENISEEAECLAKEISNLRGKAFDPCHFFTNAASNVICSVVFGKRFEYSDISFKRLMRMLNDNFKSVGSGALNRMIPFARYLQSSRSAIMATSRNRRNIMEFISDNVNEHKRVHIQNEPTDFIDVYLDEIKQRQKINTHSAVNDNNLSHTVRDLFVAGTESTATTLRWAISYLVLFPEIQHRIHQEIDSVVGRNRLPRLADKTELALTSATLLEVQRIASILPLGIAHFCGEETTIGPYTIPKGSIVLPNLWAIHHDPDLWANPDEFNPERFLDEDGELQEKEELIPFSIGRRVCIGDNLAKMELYIFFTHLLHQFTFKKPDDSPPPSLEGDSGLGNYPKPFLVEFVVRD